MVGKLESNAKLNSKVKVEVEVEVRVELGKKNILPHFDLLEIASTDSLYEHKVTKYR